MVSSVGEGEAPSEPGYSPSPLGSDGASPSLSEGEVDLPRGG